MPDEIIEELWKIKDGMAREHGNDVRKLAARLQGEKPPEITSNSPERSLVDILAEAPGGLVFKSPSDVAAYLREEKEGWDR